jgi:twitching motility protein PilT
MGYDWKAVLLTALERKASDVHIVAGVHPLLRISTLLETKERFPIPSPTETEGLARELAGELRFDALGERKAVDFSVQIDNGGRFRVNAHRQRNTIALAFRVIPDAVPPLADLNLPPIVQALAEVPQGLVLVTGHAGAGKSTTLASMIDLVNRRHRRHIITIEDPVEYLFHNQQSLVEQRELGRDVPSFADGLRDALRQDPDTIMVGEMRDLETTSSAMTAAETGHTVFSSLHTCNASQTIERIIDIFAANQQDMMRSMLSNSLQAVVSQVLFKRIDRPGSIVACEIMICTPAVRNCIRLGNMHQIPNLMQTGKADGMITMEDATRALCKRGLISEGQAAAYMVRIENLHRAMGA